MQQQQEDEDDFPKTARPAHNKKPWRIFSGISTLLAIASASLSFKQYAGGPVDARLVAAKDLGIFGTLLILTLVFFLAYRRYKHRCDWLQELGETQIANFKGIVEKRIGAFQSLMIATRDAFYEKASETPSYITFIYDAQEIRDLFNDILDSITTSLARIVSNQIKAANFVDNGPEEQVAIAIKLRINGRTAKELVSGGGRDVASVVDADDYVITLARDRLTRTESPGREIRKAIYGVGTNTAYTTIVHTQASHYISNDLLSEGNYK